MDLPRVFTIRESSHRIHNPFTSGKLGALGRHCTCARDARARARQRVRRKYFARGPVTTTSPELGWTSALAFTEQARVRAAELGVTDQVDFVHSDASGFVAGNPVDLAAWVGATWIGGGVAGTVELLSKNLSVPAA